MCFFIILLYQIYLPEGARGEAAKRIKHFAGVLRASGG